MELVALHKRVIGLDVHQAQITACALNNEVVMGSTGIYWKNPYVALEMVSIRAKVMNVRRVKNIPRRKTDVSDAHGQSTRDMIKALIANKAPHEVSESAGLESELNWLSLLQTLPSADLIGTVMLLVKIGTDMDIFGSADRLALWIGICPDNNQSAGKRKSGRVRKGTPYVRRLLWIRSCHQPHHLQGKVPVTHCAARTPPRLHHRL